MFNKITSKLTGKTAKLSGDKMKSPVVDPQGPVGLKIKQMLIAITKMGEDKKIMDDIRKITIGAARLASTPGKISNMIEDIGKLEVIQIEESASHINAEDIANGKSGRFDVCDLENWIAIAQKANVAAIEARVIERFSSDEVSSLCETIQLPDAPRVNRAMDRIRNGISRDIPEHIIHESSPENDIDIEALTDRIESAMDDIPEGWMVRTHVCGGNNLKSLAGCGLIGPDVPDVRFGPGLEVGPGWIRRGNRRALNITDTRTTSLYVQNDTKPLTVMARPWKTASRYYQGNDPHRAGTPLDVPGLWPAEWRAFVVDGVVTGVANYYGWVGETSPESARQAILVRKAAQKMVNVALAQGLEPRSMNTVISSLNENMLELLKACKGENGRFSVTLDFIETDEGILFLEGGPASNQIGGGHPCAFAGDHNMVETPSGDKVRVLNLEGVAFKTMPDVLMADPTSWVPSEKNGCILTWEDVQILAAQ